MALNLDPQRGVKKQQFKLALLLAWRDIKKHRGRSTLIATLMALPIMIISAVLVVGFSKMPTIDETLSVQFGQSAGRVSLQYSDLANLRQGPLGDLSSVHFDDTAAQKPVAKNDQEFLDLLEADYEVLPLSHITMTSLLKQASFPISTTIGDVLNPAFTGKFTLLDGRDTAYPHEALASPGFLQRFNLQLGEKLATNAGEFTIVGVIRNHQVDDMDSGGFYVQAADLPDALVPDSSETVYYLAGDTPADWPFAQRLNHLGAVLTSPELMRNPPSAEETGASASEFADMPEDNGTMLIASGALAAALVLLEVVLLAGAAFAVGTRKQQRDLALLAVSGAESPTLKAVVTSGGLWLGTLGGLAGALVGTGVASWWILHKIGRGDAQIWLHIPWVLILALVAVAALAGVTAALAPARAVAKQVLRGSLDSRKTAGLRTAKNRHRGFGFLGVAFLTLLAPLVIQALKIFEDFEVQILVSAACVILGVLSLVTASILLTAPVVRLLTAKTSWLPLPLRLSSRDSVRNMSRTVPAVAAVLAAATLSSTAMVYWSSVSEMETNNYAWSYNPNQAALPLSVMGYSAQALGAVGGGMHHGQTVRKVDSDEVIPAALASLGTSARAQVLSGNVPEDECTLLDPKASEIGGQLQSPNCLSWALQEPAENRCLLAADGKPVDLSDWRCKGSMAATGSAGILPNIVVGGEKELNSLLGRKASSESLKTLAYGGAVVSNPVFLNSDGTTTLITHDPYADLDEVADLPEDQRLQRGIPTAMHSYPLLASVEEPNKPIPYYAVISPETASRIGMPFNERLALISSDQLPSESQNDALSIALLEAAGADYSWERFETGPESTVAAGLWALVGLSALITLSATSITAGLALADGREDHVVLASIGAAPRLRKALSASQLLLTSALGTVFGIAAGTMAAVSLQAPFRDMAVVIPWAHFAVLLFLVPLVGALVAWLFTSSRLPLLRRRTLV